MTNTVSATGGALPSANLSRRSLLAGGLALPVLAATPAAAMAAGTCDMSIGLLVLIQAHRAALEEQAAAYTANESAEDALWKSGGGEEITVPRCYNADGTPGRPIKLMRLTPENDAARRQIEDFHAGSLRSGLFDPDAVEASRTRALRGLDEAIAAFCARPEAVAYKAAEDRCSAADKAAEASCLDLFAYRPRDAADATARAAFVQQDELCRAYLVGETGCHEDAFLEKLLRRLISDPVA
jgi:hypothetical protein